MTEALYINLIWVFTVSLTLTVLSIILYEILQYIKRTINKWRGITWIIKIGR